MVATVLKQRELDHRVAQISIADKPAPVPSELAPTPFAGGKGTIKPTRPTASGNPSCAFPQVTPHGLVRMLALACSYFISVAVRAVQVDYLLGGRWRKLRMALSRPRLR